MFSWDANKALTNYEKHGISFEESATVFTDPNALDLESVHSSAESRRIRLGQAITGRVLIVVYTVRKLKNGKETIRIISARQASRKERKAYSR